MYFRVYRQHLHEITVSRLFHTLLAYPETAKLGFIVLLLDIKAKEAPEAYSSQRRRLG